VVSPNIEPLTTVESDDPEWYRYRTTVDDRPFDIEVSGRWVSSGAEAAALADRLATQLLADHASLTAHCAADLLEDYNDEWSDGEELSEEEFRARLELSAFGVMPNGHIRARFAGSELFSGHDVVVDLDPDLHHSYTMLE
jgi:hypothetical protein